mgnify:CR=1 FL=1
MFFIDLPLPKSVLRFLLRRFFLKAVLSYQKKLMDSVITVINNWEHKTQGNSNERDNKNIIYHSNYGEEHNDFYFMNGRYITDILDVKFKGRICSVSYYDIHFPTRRMKDVFPEFFLIKHPSDNTQKLISQKGFYFAEYIDKKNMSTYVYLKRIRDEKYIYGDDIYEEELSEIKEELEAN